MVHKDQFRELEIPAFPEFTVVHLYEAFEGDALLLAHFPDRELQSRPVNRQWAYNVALSVRTTYMLDIINSAINKRVTQKSNKEARGLFMFAEVKVPAGGADDEAGSGGEGGDGEEDLAWAPCAEDVRRGGT